MRRTNIPSYTGLSAMLVFVLATLLLGAQDYTVTAPYFSPLRSTCFATDDCPLNDSPDHLYQVYIPTTGSWTFSSCGSNFSFGTKLTVGPSPCSRSSFSSRKNCGNQTEVNAYLTAGIYYLVVEGSSSEDCGNYLIDIHERILNRPLQANFSATAPFNSPRRSTCISGDDCFFRPSPDHHYQIEIPYHGEWTFATCDADFDSYIFLGSELCSLDIASNDDACGLQSVITENLSAGTYYLAVEAFGESECGNYSLQVTGTQTVGLEDQSATENLKLYPNPTRDWLNIEKPTSHNTDYSIFDISGKCVKKGVLSSKHSVLDISALTEGLYHLRIEGQRVKVLVF